MTDEWENPRPRNRALTAAKWVLMGLGALFLVAMLANVAETPGANLSGEPFRETREGTLATDEVAYYAYEGSSALRLKIDHTTRDGTMSVYVMDFNEADHFMRGETFSHYPPSGENSRTFANAWDLPAGKYAVALKCTNAVDPCPYTLKVELLLL